MAGARVVTSRPRADLLTELAELVDAGSTTQAEPVDAVSTTLAEPVDAVSTTLAEPVDAGSTPAALVDAGPVDVTSRGAAIDARAQGHA